MDYVRGLPLYELRDACRHAQAFRAEELLQEMSIASAPWMKREDAERLHRELTEGAASITADAGDRRPTAPTVDRSPGGQTQDESWNRLRAITAAHLSGSKRKRHE